MASFRLDSCACDCACGSRLDLPLLLPPPLPPPTRYFSPVNSLPCSFPWSSPPSKSNPPRSILPFRFRIHNSTHQTGGSAKLTVGLSRLHVLYSRIDYQFRARRCWPSSNNIVRRMLISRGGPQWHPLTTTRCDLLLLLAFAFCSCFPSPGAEAFFRMEGSLQVYNPEVRSSTTRSTDLATYAEGYTPSLVTH